MIKALKGNTVKVHYTGRLADGTVFDSSVGSEPLGFVLGDGHIIKGLDDAVTGMSVGEDKTITIYAEEAYGPRRDDLIVRIKRSQVPDNIVPEPGMRLRMEHSGRPISVVVTAADEEHVTLDANHPLSGEDLTFDLTLVEVSQGEA